MVLVILLVVLILVSIFHPNMDERIKFLTANLLNLFILAVVSVQALIYWQQKRIMGMFIDPQLRITNVRVEDFEAGKEPVFIVSIINEGAKNAKDVTLNIRVNLREGERLAIRWSKPQIVNIPAHQ